MNVLRKQSGFTLIEVIVVAGIIAVLAGILVPIIFKEIDEARKTRAAADVKSISTALMVLRKDTGQWPISDTCSNTVTMLTGTVTPTGAIPSSFAAGWDSSSQNTFNNYLATDNNGCWPTTWKGPYMATVNADPWGRVYVLNANAFLAASGPVWLLSAGPDGNVDTPANADTVLGDDVGVRLR
ncbi:MAG: type II secretion system protein GspG [Thermodesulfovibrionales bacterium]